MSSKTSSGNWTCWSSDVRLYWDASSSFVKSNLILSGVSSFSVRGGVPIGVGISPRVDGPEVEEQEDADDLFSCLLFRRGVESVISPPFLRMLKMFTKAEVSFSIVVLLSYNTVVAVAKAYSIIFVTVKYHMGMPTLTDFIICHVPY